MKLLLKFNLVFVAVFLLGLLATGFVSRALLQQNAQAEVLDHGRLLMEKALSVRNYTSKQIAPLLEVHVEAKFPPQLIPAYSATEVISGIRKAYPEYSYKEATLNPTNLRDRALEWEVDVINNFKARPDEKEFVGERDTPSGRSLYIARPIRITDAACLRCHSTVSAAPASMVAQYGPSNGFGWQLNEVIGAQVVSVPVALPYERADKALKTFMLMITAVFLLIGVTLNLMLYSLVIAPVRKLSALADRVSLGEMEAPEFAVKSKDEIGTLSDSFARMRKSLAQALKMLDA
jgi:HAMP domain-containing protein